MKSGRGMYLQGQARHILHILRVFCITAAVCAAVCACGTTKREKAADISSEQWIDQESREQGAADQREAGPQTAGENLEMKELRQNYHLAAFGSNVYFFAPEDDPQEVQEILEGIWKKQEQNQFGDERYAVYFFPGIYDEKIQARVGFYTQIAGLGALPDDVSLYNLTCDARWLGDNKNHNATCNFWRGVENLSVREYVTWAVSQATFMRRVHIGKTIYLHDSHGWASGGFLADSRVELAVNSGTQQQWLSRNCDWNTWIGENWNMVFAGIEEGKVPEGTWPEHAYTNVPVVDRIREKPFLAYDGEQGLGVFVPEIKTEAVGADWNPGEFLPLEAFYIARAETDTAETMNQALQEGKNLFLTPGIYELETALVIERDNTVVLGSGLATLRSMRGNSCMEVRGGGITAAGILFDAGPEKTDHLLAVGEETAEKQDGTEGREEASGQKETDSREEAGSQGAEAPMDTLLADLFFRVGGARDYDTEVDCCVEIHQDGVIGDNFWVWRADHGSGVGWNRNKARNGIRVTGDGVSIYALMVEHFQEYQTIWEGEDGKIVFYQCEIPYDVPNQEAWRSHVETVNGFASIKIADTVESHEAYGLGIYLYNRDAAVELCSAMEIPEAAENIRIHHICTVMITGNPGITHIINDRGDAVVTPGARAVILDY